MIRKIYALLLLAIGLVLLVGGIYLLSLGGAIYYGLAGLATLGSGVLLLRNDRRSLWLYAAMLTVTLAWGIWEAGGFEFWALVPRLVAPAVLGLGLLLPPVRRGLTMPQSRPELARLTRHGWAVFAVSLVAAVVVGRVAVAAGPAGLPDPAFEAGTIAATSIQRMPVRAAGEVSNSGDWLDYGNDRGGSRFSPLDTINAGNVDRLQVAWTADLGGADAAKAGLEVTPIKIGDTVFACNGVNQIFALDAETGSKRWSVTMKAPQAQVCRGVTYYRVPDAKGLCAERIIAANGIARLDAFDARTGAPCLEFGVRGQVDLLPGLSKAPTGYYKVTSAPAIVRGRIVIGGWVTDGQYWGEPSGVIRGFDAKTGKLDWAFDMGHPDRTGLPPEGQTYTPSTPNSWAPLSADETLGLVYLPTGNSEPDYFGGRRRPFDDHYSSSVVALDATTGRPRWSFQTAHHDLWDYDVASQPTLVDIPGPNGVQHALIQPTKRGEIFLLDRATGKPLANVEERAVPQTGAVPEERLSRTQPFSVGMPSFRGPNLRERDMWGVTPIDQMYCRIKFKQARYEGPATPPGLTPNIAYPGYLGGVDWGSVSVDLDRHLLIVNSNRVANYDRLLTRAQANTMGLKPAGEHATAKEIGGAVAQANTPYAVEVKAFLSPLGAPCQEPPYGFISAVDLQTHKLVWTRPIGTARDSGPLGIPSMLPIQMGTPNAGGTVTTHGGLFFIAATQDRYLRAIDTVTGKELWKGRLPAGGQATPMTYLSPASGRQFVVIAAGGSAGLMTGASNKLVAYALPR